ncbi:hypothetical protein [Arenimonas alkanexedens]
MGTIGTRGLLAAVFIASSGLLTGMAVQPAGDEALFEPAVSQDTDGLLHRVVRRACLISVAATRRDLHKAADRERECR